MEENETTLFIPSGYGKGTVIKDLENKAWLVGETVVEPIHKVNRISDEVAERLISQGAKLLIGTKK